MSEAAPRKKARPIEERDDIPVSAELRKNIKERNRVRSKQKGFEQKTTWNMYAWEGQKYVDYFGQLFPAIDTLPSRIRARRRWGGKPVVVLDIAGMANAKDIGADLTINVALHNPHSKSKFQSVREEFSKSNPTRKILIGDILATAMQRKLLSEIDTRGVRPLAVFFRPGGGIGGVKTPFNPLVAQRLAQLCKEVYERLDDEGEMYISMDHWHEEYDQKFFQFLEKEDIPFEYAVRRIARGFRIHKKKDA